MKNDINILGRYKYTITVQNIEKTSKNTKNLWFIAMVGSGSGSARILAQRCGSMRIRDPRFFGSARSGSGSADPQNQDPPIPDSECCSSTRGSFPFFLNFQAHFLSICFSMDMIWNGFSHECYYFQENAEFGLQFCYFLFVDGFNDGKAEVSQHWPEREYLQRIVNFVLQATGAARRPMKKLLEKT